MSSDKGLYIVLEGGDGSGKSTQVKLVQKALTVAGVDFKYVCEPGSTPLAQDIRSLLQDTSYQMSSYEELCLFSAARSVLFRTKIIGLLKSGKMVLADRSYVSTWVYQYYAGDGTVSEEIASAMTQRATYGHSIDLLIVLNVDLKTANERKERDKLDRVELKGDEFHRRVYDGYRQYVAQHPNMSVVVDARQSEEVVFTQICEVIRERLGIELAPAS